MANTSIVEATFDGEVFRPEVPPDLKPNTRVRLVVETLLPQESEETPSVLDVAMSLDLDGPPDWATNIDHYLYGNLGNNLVDGSGNGE